MPSTNGDQNSFGIISLTRIPGKTYEIHQNGLATYDVAYRGVLESGDSIDFVQGDAPLEGEYPTLVLLTFKIVGDDTICGGVIIYLHYEGVADIKYTDREVSDDVVVEYRPNHDDIYSHPNFKQFGGTPDAPLHGAKFDSNGKFDFFDIVDPAHTGEANDYAGVTTYVLPEPILTLSKMDTAWPSGDEFTSIGKITDPGNFTSNAPQLPAGTTGARNWLYESYRGRNIANKYWDTLRTFQGSGPRPINKGIYGNPPDFS